MEALVFPKTRYARLFLNTVVQRAFVNVGHEAPHRNLLLLVELLLLLQLALASSALAFGNYRETGVWTHCGRLTASLLI